MSASGTIQLDGGVIRYRSTVFGNWDLPAADVRIMGESTDQSGPGDDYWFCFASGPWSWLEASFYAEGREKFLRDLGARLGSPLELGLMHSTDFASRVLWPPSLAGEPMFQYSPIPPKGFFARHFCTPQIRQTYSERVVAVLGDGGELRRASVDSPSSP